MKRILIVGGGGFGVELFGYISADIAAGLLPEFTIAGVLEDIADSELVLKVPEARFLGAVDAYEVNGDEVVAISIGKPSRRLKVARELAEKNLPLFTYVHPSAFVAPTAILGKGAIVCPNSIVNAFAEIGDNVAVNVFCSIGHGARIGAHSVLSPYVALSGNAELGQCCFLGTRSTLIPGVTLGDNCIVDSHCRVRHSVPDKKIVSDRGKYLVLDNRLDR